MHTYVYVYIKNRKEERERERKRETKPHYPDLIFIVSGWFLSALGALTESPGLVEKLFFSDKTNPAGVYSVWVFDMKIKIRGCAHS